MKIHCHWKYLIMLLCGFAEWISPADGFAATKFWTNSASGAWGIGSTNWGPNGVAPISGDTAFITNATTKTVVVDTNSPASTLFSRNVTLAAPVGATNTLLIAGYAAPQAFQLSSGTFTINKGGTLIASNASFTNANVVLNQGAIWSASNSTVRLSSGSTFDNYGGTLTQNGGTLDLSSVNLLRIGRYSTNFASLTMQSGTVNGSTMQIGNDLGEGTLTLSNGLVTLSSYLQLGYSATGNPITGGTGIVNVAGGELRVTNDVANIGSRGPGRLNVNGGTATFALLSLGEVAGVQGIVSVSAGKLITMPGTVPVSPFTNIFRVGNQGSGELDISGGAVVSMTELSIADNPGSTGVVALTGGQLFSTNDLSSIGKYGFGQMTVSNATATFTNASVGRHDSAEGTLTVQSNGNFFALDALSIGRFTNSNGHVFVIGGLLSLTNDSLWVGREGAGDLTVSSGSVRAADLFVGKSEDGTNTSSGTVTLAGRTTLLSSNLVVGTSLVSTGHVVVAGGELSVTNATAGATLAIAQGSLTLNSGTLNADTITCNTNTGALNFNGGTLRARAMSVANGAPFIVGNSASAATLVLQGGVFSFPGGLVISPNATVTGCGTIVGPITNNGTLALTCAPVLTISSVTKTGNNFTAYFPTVAGSNYILEYKTNLSSPGWTAILPAVPGNGNVLSRIDTAATNAMRFYRLRTQ